jgi:hypothetical protein
MMKLQEALDRIEAGYGGVEEADAVRRVLAMIATLSQAGMVAWLDRDLPRLRLQLERIASLARQEQDDA